MLNKVILMGRLTRDPELRHTQSNIPVASFTLAVDRGYKRDNDAVNADFVNIVAWRGTAEFVAKWFTKGQLVAVSGRLQTRNWTDANGNNRTATEVVADEAFFAESKQKKTEGAYDMGGSEFAETEPMQGEFEEVVGSDEKLPWEM